MERDVSVSLCGCPESHRWSLQGFDSRDFRGVEIFDVALLVGCEVGDTDTGLPTAEVSVRRRSRHMEPPIHLMEPWLHRD